MKSTNSINSLKEAMESIERGTYGEKPKNRLSEVDQNH